MRSRLVFTCVALVGLLSAASSARAQAVLVVDNQGGGDFLEIQPAIDAAGPLDVILVKPSATRYAQFDLAAKSATLIGDEPGTVRVSATCFVRDLAAADRVVLRGLVFEEALGFGSGLPVLLVQGNLGKVWIEECSVADISLLSVMSRGLDVVDSASVVLLRTSVKAGLNSDPPGVFAGMTVSGSTVHAFESEFRGPIDRAFSFFSASEVTGGGPAVYLASGELFLSGCHLEGGAGDWYQDFSFPFLNAAGDGGDGLVVAAGAGALHAIDTQFVGGLPGSGPVGTGSPGTDIEPPGAVTHLPGPARTYTADSPIRAGGTTSLTLSGEEGDAVATLFSFSTESLFAFDLFGTLLVGWPIVVAFHGFLPAGDPTITLPAFFAPFPPELPYLHFYLQTFVFTPVGNAQLGSATAVTVLNQVY